ncbi:MAG: peptidase C11 [Blautia sp.]|nr:peptidase C11 [Blautia sp.]
MEQNNRPSGRKKNITGKGKGVSLRGEGTGQGPVGTGSNPFGRKDSNGSAQGSAPHQAPGSQGGSQGSQGGAHRPQGGSRPSGSVPRPHSGSSFGNSGSGSSGSGTRSGRNSGMNPLVLIIILAVLFLGGGGGLSGLLGGGSGGGSSSGSASGTFSSTSPAGTQSSYSSSSGTTTSGTAGTSTASSQTATTLSTSDISYASLNPSGENNGFLNTTVSSRARERFTQIKGNGKDTITIMVFMCGTDLESRSAMGTKDLAEMTKASLSGKINLLVYTGGCKRWQNNIVKSNVNQIYQIKDGGLACVKDNAGTGAMTDPATLTDFIRWSARNYPADRYDLILWDHGGGSLSGYGYDEKNARSGSMGLASLNKALKDAGLTYDFVGFDACLMATVETAQMLGSYADYLIASEETEPGIGWYYTNWLTSLSQNTSQPTLDTGKNIVDDFVQTCARQCRGQTATLSVVDLAELSQTLGSGMSAFSQELLGNIRGGQYKAIATARNNAREFAQSTSIDQIDFVDFAKKIGTASAGNLADILLNAVKYNRYSSGMSRAYGLSVYFPYKKMSSVNTAVQTYDALDIDADFTASIREFASLELGGQVSSGSSGIPLDSLLGSLLGGGLGTGTSGSSSGGYSQTVSGSDIADLLSALLGSGSTGTSGSGSYGYNNSGYGYLGSNGYGSSYGSSAPDLGSSLLGGLASLAGLDTSFFGGRSFDIDAAADYLAQNRFDYSQLTWQENSQGEPVIALADDQWDLVEDVARNLFVDTGTGYVELGLDDTYSWDDDGNLVGDTELTWISINDQPVAYYHLHTEYGEDDSYTITGKVPAMLTKADGSETIRVNLILVFDNENPNGYILGAQTNYGQSQTQTVARGLTELEVGDKLDFLCDYYSYDGECQDSYLLGEQMEVTEDMIISDTYLDDAGALLLYRFTDMYQQHYWTDVLSF